MTAPTPAPAVRRFPEGSVTDVERCLICHLDEEEDAAVVFRDETWSCEVPPGQEVPGWFLLRLRRHALGWADLSPAELAGFGPVVAALVQAVAAVFDDPARYVLNFGEAYPHFHCLIISRGDDVPPERRTGAVLGLREERRDRAAALAVVPAVRAALAVPAELATPAAPDGAVRHGS